MNARRLRGRAAGAHAERVQEDRKEEDRTEERRLGNHDSRIGRWISVLRTRMDCS
jgi:hypothetical protein